MIGRLRTRDPWWDDGTGARRSHRRVRIESFIALSHRHRRVRCDHRPVASHARAARRRDPPRLTVPPRRAVRSGVSGHHQFRRGRAERCPCGAVRGGPWPGWATRHPVAADDDGASRHRGHHVPSVRSHISTVCAVSGRGRGHHGRCRLRRADLASRTCAPRGASTSTSGRRRHRPGRTATSTATTRGIPKAGSFRSDLPSKA